MNPICKAMRNLKNKKGMIVRKLIVNWQEMIKLKRNYAMRLLNFLSSASGASEIASSGP